jgi:histidinol-phosphate/aromatic aminotransferase/cobyric acid decarboxylase-like protein/ubiquinone/menaquinone biosynthesis C-methylase UbiE
MRPTYWPIADWEYTADRTAREVAYLTARLPSPGRLLDAGCGLGRHAAALAEKGWSVLGVDCRTDVLAEARRRHGDRAPEARGPRFVCADLFQGLPVCSASLDAAICVQSFGWGSEADQHALLGGLRDALRPGGVLILDVTNPAWILANYAPRAQAHIDGHERVFERSYDVSSGRSLGRTSAPDGPIEHDIRLYHPTEVRRLLRAAGFDVLAEEADFELDSRIDLGTRYVQYVARRHALAPAPLARSSPARAETVRLDLRWIVEEPQLQDPPPERLFAAVIARLGLEGARDYHLEDPYGATRLAPALGLPPGTVTAGAGVSGLLAALGAAAAGAPVLTAPAGHPDLPYWAAVAGGPVRVVAAVDERAVSPGALVCLDRPAADGTVAPRGALDRLARGCAEHGALLVVDESYGAYLDQSDRLGPWAAATPGVVVLSGVSKGYGLGGLRVGWVVASPDTTIRLRRHIPPLPVGALCLALAVEVLADPARLDPLRARVRARKPEFAALLDRFGVPSPGGHPAVPWVCVDAAGAARLAAAGVAGKPVAAVDDPAWRFVVPLSDERWQLAVALLAA